jgi:GNAT superfamily N-acetyltransferase
LQNEMEVIHSAVHRAVMIAEESFSSSWPDAQALIRLHWEEVATDHDIPLSVDVAFYQKAEAAGQLCILTARHGDGAMVGYAMYLISRNLHYSQSLQAKQDVLYVHPTNRGAMVGIRLIAASERTLRDRGCQVVYHHVKVQHPILGALLARKGYQHVEQIYAKRLDQE